MRSCTLVLLSILFATHPAAAERVEASPITYQYGGWVRAVFEWEDLFQVDNVVSGTFSFDQASLTGYLSLDVLNQFTWTTYNITARDVDFIYTYPDRLTFDVIFSNVSYSFLGDHVFSGGEVFMHFMFATPTPRSLPSPEDIEASTAIAAIYSPYGSPIFSAESTLIKEVVPEPSSLLLLGAGLLVLSGLRNRRG